MVIYLKEKHTRQQEWQVQRPLSESILGVSRNSKEGSAAGPEGRGGEGRRNWSERCPCGLQHEG